MPHSHLPPDDIAAGASMRVLHPSVRIRPSLERLFAAFEHAVTALLYVYFRVAGRADRPPRVPILMYHQIGHSLGARREGEDCVTPERFEQQLHALLTAGYRVISLGQLVRLLDDSPEALRGCATLTFDDGLRGQFRNAYPILIRYGVSATFFLVAGYVGTDTILPHLLIECGNEIDQERREDWGPLSWEEAGVLACHGMEIGSHGVSHRSLGYLKQDAAAEEIRQSKQTLEAHLGIRVELFAYPFGSRAYGDFDASIQALVAAAGYRAACTTVVGRADRHGPRFALNRIPVTNHDGPFRIRCKVMGAYDWVASVKALWQRVMPRSERVDLGVVSPESAPGGTP